MPSKDEIFSNKQGVAAYFCTAPTPGNEATCTSQYLLEHSETTKVHPITQGNKLTFINCGEEGFGHISADILAAQYSVDIVCWGFDPGMCLIRDSPKWDKANSYGELLEKKAKEGVKVRLLLWHDFTGSEVQNNIVGITDQGTQYVRHPKTWIARFGDYSRTPAYANADGRINQERNQYCIDWWERNLPNFKTNPNNPNLQILLRNPDPKDVQKSLAFEEDQPEALGNTNWKHAAGTDEKGLETGHPSHHQKPVLIDYPGKYAKGAKQKAGAKEPVGYVMGLNSVTDYWDTAKHIIDDPKREPATPYAEGKELDHDVLINGYKDKKQSKVHYTSIKPYQDYACRIEGEALASVHANFELGWSAANGESVSAATRKSLLEVPKELELKTAGLKKAAEQVQIVCTQPHEQVGGEPDRSIKAAYYQAVKSAYHYIFIENQYFFYAAFARQLKRERLKFVRWWMERKGKQSADNLPQLYVFIVIPTPESDGMVPRTYQTLDELGNAKTEMPEQSNAYAHAFEHDGAKIAEQDPDFKQQPLTDKERNVLDHASVNSLKQVLGLHVSVATLKTSGKNKHGEQAYREIYIHAKLMMIDDVFVTIGSANMNQRSMAVDSEINISATGSMVGKWRNEIFKQHYGDGDGHGHDAADVYKPWTVDHLHLEDVADGYRRWNKRMTSNQKAKKGGVKNMKGFLLPFIDHRSISKSAIVGIVTPPPGSNSNTGNA